MLTPLTEEGLKLPLSGLCWLDWDDIDEDSKELPEDFNIPLIFHFLARLISFFFFFNSDITEFTKQNLEFFN